MWTWAPSPVPFTRPEVCWNSGQVPPAPITAITSRKIAGRFCSAPEADVQSLQRLRCWIWVFKDVAHLEAGFGGWQEAGEEIEDVSATSRWIRRE